MSKSFAEIARHPARIGAILALAIAVAMLALFLARLDTSALHNEGGLELDGNTAYNTGGLGVDPGTTECAYPQPASDPATFPPNDPVDCIATAAAYDWANGPGGTKGVCRAGTAAEEGTAGYIHEATPPAPLTSGDSIVCQADFYQGGTDDTSYHTGSDKDFQDISGPEPVWHCTNAPNATSKADILNGYFVSTTIAEGTDPHQVVYIGAERDSEHGAVFNGYWILQSDSVGVPVPPASVATADANQIDCTNGPINLTGNHVCGDVLVRFNYTAGGRVSEILVNQWVAPLITVAGTPGCDRDAGSGTAGEDCSLAGATAACLDATCTAAEQGSSETHSISSGGPGFLCHVPALGGDCRAANPATPGDNLCGRVNGDNKDASCTAQKPCDGLELGPGCFSTPWKPGDGTCNARGTAGVPFPTFSEVGIDLTGLGVEVPCIAAIVTESRSSPAIDATLKDFLLTPAAACESGIETDIHAGSRSAAEPPDHTVLTDCTQGTTPPSCGTPGTVAAGATVHDAAFLTLLGPSGTLDGTISFRVYTSLAACNADTARTGGTAAGTRTVSQTSGPTVRYESDDVIATGTALAFHAHYSGTALIPPSDSICEPLNVINPSMAFDKDAAPVATVTYTYQLSNSGDVELNTVTVADDKCSPSFVSGDTDGDSKLDTTETWNFACSTPIALTNGVALVNTATADAKDPLGNSLAQKVEVVTTTATLTVSDPNGN